MPIYKRCSRCGSRIPSGTTCKCQKKIQSERYRMYERQSRNQKNKEFYNGREWEIARQEALDADGGIDVYLFMTTGNIVIADTVHHIEPLKESWEKRCDVNNLMSLNHNTHSMIERKYKCEKQKIISQLKKILVDYREKRRAGGI